MNVLIVFAHPEPGSLNGALKDHAAAVLRDCGHQVEIADLHAEDFDPRLDRHDFLSLENPGHFAPQREQRAAHEAGRFAPDVKREMDRLVRAGLVIFQFPIYWFSLPAILKGWIDRVLAWGFAYGGGRWYETGAFRGKKAMLSVTCGGPLTAYGPRGRSGPLDALFYPVTWGTLRFCGFDVLPTHAIGGMMRADEATRAQWFADYEKLLRNIETIEPLKFHAVADFDGDGVLKPGLAYRHPSLPPAE